ncbi:acyltransferase [uncultured Methanomethylovorans sp.]|uniref:acyltransferase n=1 Tax=uncultured Methanomethylovorans sp. TaxID=183759 RepID=UPI002AA62155|nr:acyltransferase [uncultured Methanomethylovorans sp.]
MSGLSLIKLGIGKTLEELYLYTFLFLANLFPDLSVCSILRSLFLKPIASVGSSTRIRKNIYINSFRKLSIGKNCFINRGVQFDCSGPISIGNNCSIGFNALVTTSTHLEKDHVAEDGRTFMGEPVTIGNGVWIGANSTILPGTEIGDYCIIAAGAVVKGKLEPHGVYAGVPAKRIRDTQGIAEKRI